MEQSIAARIDNGYVAEGHNERTLKEFHDSKDASMQNATKYAMSFQIIFPVLMLAFICLLLYFAVYRPDLYNIRTGYSTKSYMYQKDHYSTSQASTKNLRIVTVVLSSFVFVMYVVGLDCTAIDFWTTRVNTDIHMDFPLEIAIPCTMLAEDLLVLIFMTFAILGCFCSKITPRWYFILLGPLSSVSIHFYHIMLGFIETPHHATSIGIAYGVIISVFVATLNVMYYFLYGLLYECSTKCCRRLHLISDGDKPYQGTEENKLFSFHRYRCPHSGFVLILFAVSIAMTLFTAYVIALFFIVPVNNAVEDGALSLQTINNTVLIFFTGAVTYKIYKDKRDTIIDFLVNAMNNATTIKARRIPAARREEVWTKLANAAKKQYIQTAARKFLVITVERVIHSLGLETEGEQAADESVKTAAYEAVRDRMSQLPQIGENLAANDDVGTKFNQLVQSLASLIKHNAVDHDARLTNKAVKESVTHLMQSVFNPQAGTEPTQQQAATEPTQQQAATEPTQQQAATDPTQQQAATEPTQQQAATDPTQQQAATEPTQQQAATEPTQQQAATDPTQQQKQKAVKEALDELVDAVRDLLAPADEPEQEPEQIANDIRNQRDLVKVCVQVIFKHVLQVIVNRLTEDAESHISVFLSAELLIMATAEKLRLPEVNEVIVQMADRLMMKSVGLLLVQTRKDERIQALVNQAIQNPQALTIQLFRAEDEQAQDHANQLVRVIGIKQARKLVDTALATQREAVVTELVQRRHDEQFQQQVNQRLAGGFRQAQNQSEAQNLAYQLVRVMGAQKAQELASQLYVQARYTLFIQDVVKEYGEVLKTITEELASVADLLLTYDWEQKSGKEKKEAMSSLVLQKLVQH